MDIKTVKAIKQKCESKIRATFTLMFIDKPLTPKQIESMITKRILTYKIK